MFSAHLAAGLAIKAAEPRAPTWAVLTGAFLPDLAWIALAGLGVEPTSTGQFFDGWSHSGVSILIEATLFAAAFFRCGPRVQLAVWMAVASHLPLDGLIHPQPLQLYPHSSIHIGLDDWSWGETKAWLGFSRYWWVQTGVTAVLLAVYARLSPRLELPWRLTAASVVLVGGLRFFV